MPLDTCPVEIIRRFLIYDPSYLMNAYTDTLNKRLTGTRLTHHLYPLGEPIVFTEMRHFTLICCQFPKRQNKSIYLKG